MARGKLLARRSGVVMAVVAFGGLTVGATARDIEDLPAKEIAEKALDASRNADSFRINSQGVSGAGDYRIDVSVGRQGDCRGTDEIDGRSAQFIKIGDTTYTRGNEAFWSNYAQWWDSDDQSEQRMVETMQDRWLKAPAGADALGLAEWCDVDYWHETVKTGGLKKTGTAEVDGQPVITLTNEQNRVTDRLYVATEGQPYFLKYTSSGGDYPFESTVKDYNKPINVKAPPADDVIDLNRLREVF
ncbi:hypothetical protein QFZ22_000661 [Streptomyces canus]|uniref:Lipoprotein n=1 Tax=Streptomyces canus TaxID=58343 RepID=A0AAW8F5Z6_9ACTN|nr:hypothetical protein [Streptomyces canus]MDQ0904676.1 hypothetical protein [Streptomyces canus]